MAKSRRKIYRTQVHLFFKNNIFLFYGKSEKFSFLTMSKVKMGHILPKWKNDNPNFLYIAKYIAKYQNIDRTLKKCWGKFCLFLPRTQSRYWLPRPSFYTQVQNSFVWQYIFISKFDFCAKQKLCPKKFMPRFGHFQKSHLLKGNLVIVQQ